ncbi:MAG TPA: phospholipase [Flavobacteriales bacterium]|nr:phospholipase [Flavobacteriales bacterium]
MAEYFIGNFEVLLNQAVLIVAPEGLNKFYKNGLEGDVGASWMTKADRLNEIMDYNKYLDNLYDKIFQKMNREEVQVNILGFSQGSSTACRWIMEGNAKFDNLVIWSGGIPNDLEFEKFRGILSGKPLQVLVGDDDTFIKESDIAAQEKMLMDRNIDYKLTRFQGGHNVEPEVLKHLAETL